MKRRDFVRHLERSGRHPVFVNRAAGKSEAVPRHREVNEHLARRVCKDLEIPSP